jgi:hypothetical protein
VLCTLLAICLGHSTAAQAQEATASDEAGFELSAPPQSSESTATEQQPQPESSLPSIKLSTTLWRQIAVRTESSEPTRLAKLRQVLDAQLDLTRQLGLGLRLRAQATLHTEADFAYLGQTDLYGGPEVETYGWQARTGETYASLSGPAVELTVGYQQLSLGVAEMISLLDLVSPRDVREPMPTDLSHLKLPVLMSRLGVTVGPMRAYVLAVHQPNFGLLPPPLGELSPFRQLLLNNRAVGAALESRELRLVHEPNSVVSDLGATQLCGRLAFSLGSIDLSLVAGSVFERMGIPTLPDPETFQQTKIDLTLVHPRYNVLGHGGATTLGPVVLRWEASLELSRPIAMQRTDTSLLQWSMARHHVVSGLLGLAYSPTTQTSAALEASMSRIVDPATHSPDRVSAPLFPLEAPQFALRFTQRFWRERASLSLFALLIGIAPINGLAARSELAVSVTDRLEVAVGYVLYHSTAHFGLLYGLGSRDRIFLNLRLSVGD